MELKPGDVLNCLPPYYKPYLKGAYEIISIEHIIDDTGEVVLKIREIRSDATE